MTIEDLERVYKEEKSLYKKVYIYAFIQKMKKKQQQDNLEKDLLKKIDSFEKGK